MTVKRFAFNVVPLNLDSDSVCSSNLRLQIVDETTTTGYTSRNRIYLILTMQLRMHLMETRP